MHTLTLEKPIVRDFALVLLASFVICLSGQISIPLWFTPIPIATRNSIILLMSALLGARRGSLATFLFLAQGLLGLPVFSNGHGGFQWFMGPTGGYLIGYLLASYLVGTIVEKYKSPILALTAGNLLIYFCGAGYLSTFVGGPVQALLLGVVPFLLGDFLKMIVSLKIISQMRSL